MAKPTNKVELLHEAAKQYRMLIDLIDTLSENEQEALFLFTDRDKNLRDVLIHLHEWHRMMEKWYHCGMVEKRIPITPAPGYTWRTLPALNLEIWNNYQTTSLAQARLLLEQSHERIVGLIQEHTNEELFTRHRYPWTKNVTLGAYFISSSSSHYLWAQKKIKKQIRLLKAQKEK